MSLVTKQSRNHLRKEGSHPWIISSRRMSSGLNDMHLIFFNATKIYIITFLNSIEEYGEDIMVHYYDSEFVFSCVSHLWSRLMSLIEWLLEGA